MISLLQIVLQAAPANADHSSSDRLEVLRILIPGLVTLGGIVCTAWLGYRFALKKMRKEASVQVQRDKFSQQLKALEGCWKLLVFTTDTENKRSIVTFTQEAGTKSYFFNPENAQAFLDELVVLFWSSGLGIYLPATIKQPLFEYRSILFGVLLKEKGNTATKVTIHNTHMVNQLKALHEKLLQQLKHEMDYNTNGRESVSLRDAGK